MRQDIWTYIEKLSAQDNKTLTQKALKLGEESGETAKAVLAYENAQCTRHRFIIPEKILEEVADTILVALSMAYDLGYSNDDLADMLKRKADYWAELQAREALLQTRSVNGTPFEIHVTVKEAANLENFRQACAILQVKPIVLDLHTRTDAVINDIMTSSVFFGQTNAQAYAEAQRISDGLKRAGYEVIRVKIETVPWHPAAPSRSHAKPVMPPDCYFECHFNVRLASSEDHTKLKELAAENKCHLSRNVFKRNTDGSSVIMMTVRDYSGTCEDFQERVTQVVCNLRKEGFHVEKEVVEFSIYDSKSGHDASWTSLQAA